ncbi:uncharacterized protein LOC124921815 [Impatiens glandulifera]|uniref:uncharacterized protein LOC124921815 n=1 Tax=Impatiens glandulifera TaxID=253017 RepID=UPI001FB0AAE0|nr:uncharacterized protein LOC124921815 [Impatiens glandulifera]
MGCTTSKYMIARKKKKLIIPEIAVFTPSLRIPVHCDLQKSIKGLIPNDLVDRIISVRNQIILIAEDTGGSATNELLAALEEYLPLLLGFTNKDHGLLDVVEFKWRDLDGRHEVCIANPWFEILSVIHLMAMLTLAQANFILIPKDRSGSFDSVVSADNMRDAVDLLLKASSYLEFCVKNLLHFPIDIKKRLPKELQDNVLQGIAYQALGQGTEIQLGLAMESQNATSSVKRRLACEQLGYLSQAHYCLSDCNIDDHDGGYGKKNLSFIKWKYLEAKAASYYFHGVIVDKGSEPSCQVSAVCCYLAADGLLTESKKACLSFCLANPITRAPPAWGGIKQLNKKVPELASKKSQMYGYLLEQEKDDLQGLPDLPEFQLSLRPEDWELPEIDSAWVNEKWEIPTQPLKEHLEDSE